MNIPKTYLKTVLCYLTILNQKLSIYQFELIISNSFRSMSTRYLAGEYYRVLLDNGFICLCKPERKQREAFKVTELGKEFISTELLEQQVVLNKIKQHLYTFEADYLEVNPPFLKFLVKERRFKIMVLLDGDNSKLKVSLPNNSTKAVEYIEYPLNDVLNDPNVLIERISVQINDLKSHT